MEPRGMDWRGQLEGNQFPEMKRDLRFTDGFTDRSLRGFAVCGKNWRNIGSW